MTITFLPDLAFIAIMVFARIGVMTMLMPGVANETVPVRIRLSLALLITLLLVPVVGDKIPQAPGTPYELFFALFQELLVGFVIGLTAAMIMSALQTAGATIAFQTSLSSAQNTDITTSVQGTLVANFLTVVAITLVFAMDIHFIVIAAMYDSYTLFPPGEVLPIGDVVETATKLFGKTFLIGVQMAAPFIVIGVIFNVGSGVIARLMPQFQVLLVLLPANLMIGFFFLFSLLSTMMMWYMEHLRDGLSVFLVK